MAADPPATTVPALLAARAAEQPDRVALLADGAGALTFAQWRARADALAHGLCRRGVRRGDRVALLFDGGEWLDFAVAYCAVTAAGGVAVPLSARAAPAQVRAIVTGSGAAGLLHGTAAPPPPVDAWTATAAEFDGAPVGSWPVPVAPDDLAQIVYTSGTTGEPKGVAARHANVTFGLATRPARRPLAHSEHFLHAFPIGTNAAQTMLLYALGARPTAVVADRFDADSFAGLIARHRVGTVFVVPAMAIDLLRARVHERHDLSSVRLLASTAAPLPAAVARALCAALPGATVVNNYTSTEAAPAHTTIVFDPDRPDALGRPAAGAELRIAGPDGAPVPAGTVGEVWLRSAAAPRSYFGDARASAEVFRDGWTRMGDLGYLDGDGYLHLVDRESDVVKSGAFKVSTLRVESVLHEHPAVADAAVVGVPHPTMGTMLAAAVVPRAAVGTAQLRAYLAGRLAEPERPTRLLLLDALPRNEGGKVLKSLLRERFTTPPKAPAAPPASPAEAALAALWAQVLAVPAVGRDDDFFALGGDSLRATQLATLAAGQFAAEVPVSLVFDHPRLAEQAARLAAAATTTTEAEAEAAPEATAAAGTAAPPEAAATATERATPTGAAATGRAAPAEPPGDTVPLSAQQENFFVWMHATDPPRDVGPVSVALRITDELDPELLRRSLHALVRRHEALRTVFVRRDGRYEARVRPDCPPRFTVTAVTEPARAAELVRADREHDFDLATGPLVRAIVVTLGPDDHVFGLAVHHLVFDGWSMGVLLRELGIVYSALRGGRPPALPELPIAVSQAVAWTRTHWPRTRPHWQRTLEGAPGRIEPCPGRRRAVRLRSASLEFRFAPAAAERLRALARAHDATPFTVATAAWAGVLATWSGAGDVVLMSPVPGRARRDFEPLVGCLVQPLLLRLATGGDPTFAELLRRARAAALTAIDHQYYPYAEFYPRFPDTAWLRYESWGGSPHFPGLLSEPFDLPRALDAEWDTPGGEPDRGAPELALVEQPDGALAGWLLWNAHAFARSTMDAVAGALLRLADAAPQRPHARLSELVGAIEIPTEGIR